jgi:hypothetical protein
MRHPLPPIREDETASSSDCHMKWTQEAPIANPYLLATRLAQDPQDVAHLLGVHHNTISRWLRSMTPGPGRLVGDVHPRGHTCLARAGGARQH